VIIVGDMNKRTPARIIAIRDQIMADAAVERECTRCDGHGVRDDNPKWIVVADKGVQAKLCFRCKGSGREPKRNLADPLKVRYAVADKLLPMVEAGKVEAIRKERDHQEGASLMWPILVDVFERAIAAAERNRAARHPARQAKPASLHEAMVKAPWYALETLYKHHPDADYEELCEAFGAEEEWIP